jgi:glycolate oxidase iron-sulfur subunit
MEYGQRVTSFLNAGTINDAFLDNCIHCGLCLPTCPTYSLTGLERSSPRGRIRLIKAVHEGSLPLSKEFAYEMDFCLDCQACETACPAGVNYGSLVEAARALIHRSGVKNRLLSTARYVLLTWLFGNPVRLKALARILRIYQVSGMQKFIETTRLLCLVSRRLHEIHKLAPPVSKFSSTDVLPERSLPEVQPRLRVIVLTGCIMDVAFADVNFDTVKLLLHCGCEVIVPKRQFCCGSLQVHNGDREGASSVAKKNIDLFLRYEFDYIVTNSASCGAFMKDYGVFFSNDPEFAEKAKSISSRVRDLAELLDEIHTEYAGQPRRSSFEGIQVTYHDACHLVHAQRISGQPRRLIQSISGVQYVELPDSTWCCGSAGIYNITHFNDSMQMLERKMSNIKALNPQIVVTGNPGCLMQLKYGARRAKLPVEVMHTATFLRKAYGI